MSFVYLFYTGIWPGYIMFVYVLSLFYVKIGWPGRHNGIRRQPGTIRTTGWKNKPHRVLLSSAS